MLVTNGGAASRQGCPGLARGQPRSPGERSTHGAPSRGPPAAGSSRHPEIRLCSPNASPEETRGVRGAGCRARGMSPHCVLREQLPSSPRSPSPWRQGALSGGVADGARLAPAVHGDVPEADKETCGWVATQSLPWVHRAPARSRKVTRTLPNQGVPVPPKTLPPHRPCRELRMVKR